MQSKRLWTLIRLSRRLWVRAALIALLAILAAVAAALFDPIIPAALAARIGENAVMPVLNVLASSMLAVTTFSLSVMVSAHQQASSQVTPRSHRLLLEDTTTQTVLATFLGAFIFALVSIILFRAELYTGAGPVVLFLFTVLVVGLVVLAILRWIDHLSRLGSVDQTIAQLEGRARATLAQTRAAPSLGARPLSGADAIPPAARPVPAPRGGHVQFIDMGALSTIAEREGAEIYIAALPGDFIVAGMPLVHVLSAGSPEAEPIQAAFGVQALRSFDQDARFALMVLAEIASRALSPGLNDPGTAIDVIGRLERLLAECDPPADEVRYPRLWARAITADELVQGAFAAIARDGAGLAEVAQRLVAALHTLRAGDDPGLARAAQAMTSRALAHAEQALVLEEDRAALRAQARLPAGQGA
ncbi:DUF2254 domain-containing protein [Rhodovulum adriaticum]|uniref:Putative membrane protein n=1 Tax=Rhodovulum adriaticum TaxID=35804 RepID=A0A4R2P0G1_RHOAD|nr:DUF2254 domain-containing protein [Rhodovulum adriaticum]MBK1634130.1 hypothetical protein [Rhodovulum adriaticum]TCP27321.1 putative membrane protein [Rhodovulum adriaticum]